MMKNQIESFLEELKQQYLESKHFNIPAHSMAEAGTINIDLTRQNISAIHEHLNSVRAERLRQARFIFNTAIALIILGTLIVFTGLIVSFYGQHLTGLSISGVGAMIDVVSALLLKFNKDANDRLDLLAADISRLEKLAVVIEVAGRIENESDRRYLLEAALNFIA